MTTTSVTVVGGGLAGLVAAVTAAGSGAPVRLLEAHATLGGRARTTAPPHLAHEGPHVLYGDGALWRWLVAQGLARPYRRLPVGASAAIRFRRAGRLRRAPSAGLVRMLAHRDRRAPVDQDFLGWATGLHGEATAAEAAAFAGVATFTADPGALSAAFVWERLLRVSDVTGGPRYLVGGWSALVERLAGRARELGVQIAVAAPVTELPDGPVVVATSLPAARRLLGRDLSSPATSGSTILVDAAVRARRGDAFIVSDLDGPGWVEAFSRADRTLCPPGTTLLQAQRPPRGGETREEALRAAEDLVDAAAPGWRDRRVWSRDAVAHRRSGALDPPGRTWRDRPAVDQGDGVFLAGDEVAAPGLLAEVSFHSAVAAAHGACAALRERRSTTGAATAPGRLPGRSG
jgi:phytoene dehydrogenase-like protein